VWERHDRALVTFDAQPGFGALAFCGVILIMFAAETFDPLVRPPWLAASSRSGDRRSQPLTAAIARLYCAGNSNSRVDPWTM
jgi:hypothetical protein